MGTFIFPLLSSLLLPLWAFGGWRGRINPPSTLLGILTPFHIFFSLYVILIPHILQTLKWLTFLRGRFRDIVLRLEILKALHKTYWKAHGISFVLWKHSRCSLTFSKFLGLRCLQCCAVSSGMHAFKNVAHIVYDRWKGKMKGVSVRFVCDRELLQDTLEIGLEWG